MRTISATEFKARCLALLDEVANGAEPITILKRGKPVAQLVAPTPRSEGYPQNTLLGTVEVCGDILGPVLPSEVWEAEAGGHE